MRREIAAAVFFLKRFVKKGEELESHKVELFVEKLAIALQDKFRGHWYPENPSKGQAYRCIRVNKFYRQDPELLRACRESGVQFSDLALPYELTLWVDPGEVCCRYGEQNPCFSLVTFSGDEQNKDVAKKQTSSSERVTSDCHSCSYSVEERTHTSPLMIANSRCTFQPLNPSAPTWHPGKKKTAPANDPMLSWPHYSIRPCSQAPHTLKHNLWVHPGFRGGPGYWETNQNQAHCYTG